MKKLYFLLYTSFSVLGFSQTILTQQESGTRTVQDPNVIVLAPGFRATSSVSNPFVAKIGASTDTSGGGPNTPSTAGSGNPSGTITPTGVSFHNTQGDIDVTSMGQLQYTLPIATPPGIKNVAPQINFLYTSGSGNGIARYGWSISGITSISRIAKTIENNGEVKGIQLDYSDYYSFNGQRLILKNDSPGTYGQDGAEYITEKFSNIKIKSIGAVSENGWQGPKYWEVTFEDGSQAWFGSTPTGENSEARTPIEYNIVKWKDIQGNSISYSYIQSDNASVINTIEWGGNEELGKPNFNKISFEYSLSLGNKISESYIKGIKFFQNRLITKINVFTNGNKFKRYEFSYTASAGYLNWSGNLYQIKEFNSNDEMSNPVTFNYDDYEEGANEWQTGSMYKFDENSLQGDFNANGKSDILTYFDSLKDSYNTTYPSGMYLFDNTQVYLGNGISKDDFLGNSITVTYKKNNQISNKQGFAIFRKKINASTQKKDIEISFYTIEGTQINLDYTKTIANHLYDNSVGTPTSNPRNPDGFTITSVKYKSLDLNGDGISEIILDLEDKIVTKELIPDNPGSTPMYTTVTNYEYRYLIINIDENLTGGHSKVTFSPIDVDIFSTHKIADFDGDGLVDFLKIENNKIPSISKISQKQDGSFERTTKPFGNAVINGLTKYAILGDYNGDGKTDFYIPKTENKQSLWYINTSTGLSFIESESLVTSYVGGTRIINNTYDNSFEIERNQQISVDLNGDGKDEFWPMIFKRKYVPTGRHEGILYEYRLTYHSVAGTDTGPLVMINPNDLSSEASPRIRDYIAITGNFSINSEGSRVRLISLGTSTINNQTESVLIENRKTWQESVKGRIIKIIQGGQTISINYKDLDKNISPDFYNTVKKENYPYMELEDASKFFAVSRITKSYKFENKDYSIQQDFKYRGLVLHLQGRGLLGFRKHARSSWYATGKENTVVWSGIESDPLLENVPIKSWSTKVSPIDSNVNETVFNVSTNTALKQLTETVYKVEMLLNNQVVNTYSNADKPKIVKVILPWKTKSFDFLKDVTAESETIYGDFYMPEKITNKVNDDFAVSVTEMTYEDNSLGSGKDYYIGRPLSKTYTTTANGHTTGITENYRYKDFLLSSVTKTPYSGTTKSRSILDTFTYDKFGNIIQVESGIPRSSPRLQPRKEQLQFDSTGRFIIAKTDNLGLVTNFTYNDAGQVKTQTDPLGNILTNEYDSWGKLLKSNNSLTGTTNYLYKAEFFFNDYTRIYTLVNTIIKETSPDGNIQETHINANGQSYKVKTKGFSTDSFILTSTKYDALNRKIAESDPYFEGTAEANLTWNVFEYDDSVFPAKVVSTSLAKINTTTNNIISFAGIKIETTLTGRTSVVKELNGYERTFTKTTDAIGNIISSTDKGGTVTFTYNAAGQNTSATYGQNIVSTKYDDWGRKIEFYDPANGKYTFDYNGFGQLLQENSPKGEKKYTYNDFGQLKKQEEKTTKDGTQNTDKNIAYSYNSYGMLIQTTGIVNGKAFSSTNNYDNFGRILSSAESSNGKYFIKKGITYDYLGRIISYEKSLYSSGILTKAIVENKYSDWSGELYQLNDKSSGKTLWELTELTAKGLISKAKLGGTSVLNTYSPINHSLSNVTHDKTSDNNVTVLQAGYTFNTIKNELSSRSRGGDFSIIEGFTYDNNNRLEEWSDPRNSGTFKNTYDIQGRITENDQVGKISFANSGSIYRPSSFTINLAGTQNYTNDLLQKITYNENNDPVFIDGVKGDVRFTYGLSSMRQMATYGGDISETVNGEGIFTKYYSEDGTSEIIRNNQTGQEKHMLYIGGSPYESNIVYLKDYNQGTAKYVFLHKDYLGSILAISDEAGNVLEQRHFDAWGNLTHLKIETQTTITDKNQIRDYLSAGKLVVDRGYTSHEHFAEIGIIHMNGRLYDPLLRRFLNADENIQDPYNTQNYNKYGYVMNNPLMYNDPSGEFIWWLAGAVIGGYASGVQANGGNWNPMKWDWSKTWSAVVGGAFAGAGLGMVIENTGASGGVKILEGSLAGAVGGAFNAIISGKNILSGALTGSFFQAGFAGINYVSSNFINSPSTYRSDYTGSYDEYLSSIGVMTYETYLVAEVVIKVKGKGTRDTWKSSGNFAYNSAIMESGTLNALQDFNRHVNRLNLAYAIANSKAAQQIEAFEKFLFIELPLQYAGGAVLSVGWRAVRVGRMIGNGLSRFTTDEGFLLGSVGFKLPFNLNVGLYASENTLKYGTFKWSTIAPKFITKYESFGRNMLQITPEFQPTLGNWSSQVIPKGTYIKMGLVGQQRGNALGTWLQFYTPAKVTFIP